MNSLQSHSHMHIHASIYLAMQYLFNHVQTFTLQINCMQTLQQVWTVCKEFICNFMSESVFLVDTDCRHCYIG